MKTCIFMLGHTERRSKEAHILASLYRDSGLGLSVQVITDADDNFKHLDNSLRASTSIIIIDLPNLENDSAALIPLLNRYKIQYRVTDNRNYTIKDYELRCI